MRLLLSSVLGLALLTTACAEQGPPHRFRGHGEGRRPGGPGGPMGPGGMGMRGLFVSPAGEPFRAAPGQSAPLDAWFAGADSNHDGILSFAEFQADFRRFFATLDTNHDGEIAPDEVTRYETEILPEMSSSRGGFGGAPRAGGGGGYGRGGGMGRGGSGGGMGRGGMGRGGGGRMGGGAPGGSSGGAPGGSAAIYASGAARFGLLAIPHPIMAADDDMNRGVSAAEFDHAAMTRFTMLDDSHNGRLTLAQLEARRAQMVQERVGMRRRDQPRTDEPRSPPLQPPE